MRRYIKIIILLCAVSLALLTSYSNKNLEKHINELNKEIEILKEENWQIQFKNDDLSSKIRNYKKKEEEESQLEKKLEYNWIYDKKFAWLKNRDWDKVTISNSVTGEVLDITENELFKKISMEQLFKPLTDNYGFFCNLSSAPQYTYTFEKGNIKHNIAVINSITIKLYLNYDRYDGHYYNSNSSWRLGQALMAPAEYEICNNVLQKIYNSGVMIESNKDEEDIYMSKAVIHAFAEYIQVSLRRNDIVEIKSLPKENLSIKYNLTFYCHGDKVIMNLYDYNDSSCKYIEIADESNNIYYEQINYGHNIRYIFGCEAEY